jgi:molecular chaperone DnaJ
VRASQGFFSVERTCPRCGGQGRVVSDPCRTCNGHGMVRRERTLQVRIPAGVEDGARIRLAGEGDAGARGGPRGDLYIFLSVQAHELFERDGLDLLCTVPVTMCTAALGGEIEAPCLGISSDGDCRKIPVRVPEGSQTGHNVRLKGRGMPALRGRDRGDLVVELYVETPTSLSARQKELMRELAEEGRTMLVVTHEMSFARDVSNKVMFLHQGRVEEEGNPKEIFAHPKSERFKQFISSIY